ncbi:MAG: LacI family transcriptional regulator [Devosia sp.]|nr:LacI family transcriptional regulator [Devosia sp.]
MKATVADIAKASGMSTATVDRVLNARAGVRPTTKQRVMQAAQELGYLPVVGNVVFPSKPANLEFFIPIGSNAFLAELAEHIEDYCRRLPLVASCRIRPLRGIQPEHLKEAVQHIALSVHGIGVIAVDLPKTRHLLHDLVDSGIRVVTIASDVPTAPRSAYVGIDNRVAGRTAALLMGRFLAGRAGSVAILTGSKSYRGHEEREMGFRSVIQEDFCQLDVNVAIEINDEPQASFLAAMRLLNGNTKPLGIYCVGAGRSGIVKALLEHDTKAAGKPVFICHDLTRQTRSYLVDDICDVVIDQNARLLAEQSVIQLLGSIASSAPYLTKKLVEPRIFLKENLPAQ